MRSVDAPPPPVVTIVDPAAPGPLHDVVVLEPAPRWTREQRLHAWLAAAAVVLAALGTYSAHQLRDDRRLDREALRGIALSSIATGIADAGALRLALLNQGREPVSVVSARVAAPGYGPLVAVPNTLAPGEPVVVRFRRAACPRDVPARYDAPVDVLVRTYRGGTRTVRFAGLLDGSFIAGFLAAALESCGLYPPAFSLEVDGVASRRAGPDLVLGLVLANRAQRPRTLVELLVGGGLALVRPGPPLALAAGGSGLVEARLRVVDCAAALGAWALVPQQQGFTPTYRSPPGGGSLDARVEGDGTTETAVGLVSAGSRTVTTWLRSVCPA